VIEKPDKELHSKLLAEAEGIFAWAVRGAADWYRNGLGKPPEVEQANSAWRKDMDQVGRFADECCLIGQGEVKGGDLYEAYRRWAERSCELAMSGKAFGEHIRESNLLRDGGVIREERSYGNVYVHMSLRENAEST
jgi:phage/plasmid-associated DNA primase